MATVEMGEMELDGMEMEEGMEEHPPVGDGEPEKASMEIPNQGVVQSMTLKAVGKNAGRTEAKKALDSLVNAWEAEGWEVKGFGHAEKFDDDLNVIHTFTAKMEKAVRVSLLTYEVM